MNSNSDPFPPSMPSPQIFDTDMDGSMQENGIFFNSALPADSPGNLFGDDSLVNSPFQSPISLKTQNMQMAPKSTQKPPEMSTSPESSADSSSNGSSRRKRKSSSRSSHSGDDSNMADGGQPVSWGTPSAFVKNEPMFDLNGSGTQKFDNFEFDSKTMENDMFDFDSAASSPSPLIAHSNLQNNGPRGFAIPYRDSPQPPTNLLPRTIASASGTRETSPLSTMVSADYNHLPTQSHTSPASSHEDYIDYSLLSGADQQTQWPYSQLQIHPGQLAIPNQHNNSLAPHMTSVGGALGFSPRTTTRSSLLIHPTPQKSRVETQIPIKMTLYPVPKGVTKLHLPTHTISKPKLLARPPPSKSADTLELHTMLVCTSAMQDPVKLRRAFARAAGLPLPKKDDGRRSSSGDTSADDESKPLNGGEVHICVGCITRERKRAARKKSKKPEEEEPWQKDEAKRIIVFNCPEVREWVAPAAPSSDSNNQAENVAINREAPPPDVPEGAMQLEVPMRIACYCRHQSEKLGFQVILTIKDHKDNLVAQAITNSIVITDDHKTHAPPPSIPQNGIFGEQAQLPMFGGDPQGGFGLYRNAHSTTDLQGLQQQFQPQFSAQNMSPFAIPQNTSQNTSTSMTPRNLSRQASPSAGGPAPKKRKASGGSVKLPDNLTMTRLQTGPSTANVQNQQWSAPGQTYPISPPVVSPFAPTFPSLNSPQERQVPRHTAQRSTQLYNGPPTPGAENGMFSHANHSQSLENISTMQMFSAPPSARASRAASPITDAQGHHHGLPMGALHAAFSPTAALNPQRPPTIHKLIPNEGPKAGGIEVTCLGSGFQQGLEVMFGDSLATTTTYWGETSLVCLLPPAICAGTVAVTFKHEYQQRLQMARFNPAAIPKNQTYFKYVDDDEQELLRQALLIVHQKMTGIVEDAGDIARRIISQANNSSSSWSGGNSQGEQRRHASSVQAVFANTMDAEATVLKCLDLIDLDDSPYLAELNLERKNGQSMLHMAASLGYHRLVAALLARKANPDLRDHNGMSPMHMAALNGHAQIVKRLRLAGGDPTLRSLLGYTPADMATSQSVLAAVEFSAHARSRSVGATPHSYLSRASSMTSLISYAPTSSGVSFRPEGSSEDEDSEAEQDSDGDEGITMSTPRNAPVRAPPTIEVEESPSPMFLAAWGDHIATQIQAFHQSVNRNLPNSLIPALPNLPNFDAYQAHPMVRRFSSLVPQRNPTPPGTSNGPESKENNSKWWEILRSSNVSPPPGPPAYDDIYPATSQTDLDTKTTSAATAAADAVADEKCAALYESGQASSSSSTVPSKSSSRPSTPKIHNVKSLSKDRKLFFFWIPVLMIVLLATSYQRVPQLLKTAERFMVYVHEQRQQGRDRIVEVL